MALRDKLRAAAEPHLAPGERIEQVFLAQAGMSPWLLLVLLGGLIGLIALVSRRPLILAVTDRSVVVLRAGRFRPSRAKEFVARLPRQSRIGPTKGRLWAKVDVAGQRLWVHRRFFADVVAADAPLLAPPPPTSPPTGWRPARAIAPDRPWDTIPFDYGEEGQSPGGGGQLEKGVNAEPDVQTEADLPAPAPPPEIEAPLVSSRWGTPPPRRMVAVPMVTGRWPLASGGSRKWQWVLAGVAVLVTAFIVVVAVGLDRESEARERVQAYVEGKGRHSFFAATGASGPSSPACRRAKSSATRSGQWSWKLSSTSATSASTPRSSSPTWTFHSHRRIRWPP